MRMRNINPILICDQHLLGEHVEMHMFDGCIKKMKSLRGYIEKGLVEIHNIEKRHNELADEMLRRGFRHKSPLRGDYPMYRVFQLKDGKVDVEANVRILKAKCEKCRERIERYENGRA